MYCRLCGAENEANAECCQNCGSDMRQDLADIVLTESVDMLPEFEEGPPIVVGDKGKDLGTVGLVIGVLVVIIPMLSGCFFCGCGASLIPFFGPFGSLFASIMPIILVLINLVCSIVGIACSAIGKSRSKKCGYKNKRANGGLAFSVIALVISAITLIITVIAAIVPTFAALLLGLAAAVLGVLAGLYSEFGNNWMQYFGF